MKKLITLIAVIIAGTMTFYAADYPGGLPGLFSINAHGGQVRIAQGNLQYLASTDTWRFASNQHDTIGVDNRISLRKTTTGSTFLDGLQAATIIRLTIPVQSIIYPIVHRL